MGQTTVSFKIIHGFCCVQCVNILSASSRVHCYSNIFPRRSGKLNKIIFNYLILIIFLFSKQAVTLLTILIYYMQIDLFQSFYTHVFNGCYAVLLFIVVVFFLIYGVEVYFKVS